MVTETIIAQKLLELGRTFCHKIQDALIYHLPWKRKSEKCSLKEAIRLLMSRFLFMNFLEESIDICLLPISV